MVKKLGVLFSGGKDSMYAAYLADKEGYEISCLITIISQNPDSYMFHTPSVGRVKEQAEVMNIPLITCKTEGEKEKELEDLERVIRQAIDDFEIEGIVSGAVESVYQASRIQKICNKLGIECFNPLWQKGQFELLDDLIDRGFEVIVTGVFAEGLGKEWLGRKIDKKFIEEIKELNEKYGLSVSGEGGEFESFVLNCPLFGKKLNIVDSKDYGKGNSWRREVKLE